MADKKIAAIYACLDNGNHAEAVRLCQKPGMAGIPLVQSLLSYAYAVMKRRGEALDLAQKILQTPAGTDESVMTALSHTFRICRADEQAVKMYEVALAANLPQSPSYEHLSQELFATLSRLGLYKKMQLLAQKMAQALGSDVYVLWSVCSMMLQSPQDFPPAMLPLAEKKICKVFSEACASSRNKWKLLTNENIHLASEIFKRQGKQLDALILFDELLGKAGEKIFHSPVMLNDNTESPEYSIRSTQLQFLTLRLELLQSVFRIESELNRPEYDSRDAVRNQIVDCLEAILRLYPDQWDAHSQYLELLRSIPSNLASSLAPRYQSLLLELRGMQGFSRGPYLAEIYLAMNVFESWEAPVKAFPLLLDYITRFGDKQCCFSDLRPLFTLLIPDDVRNLVKAVIAQYQQIMGEIDSLEASAKAPIAIAPQVESQATSKVEDSKSKKKGKGKGKKASPSLTTVPQQSLLPQENLKAFVATHANAPNKALLAEALTRSCRITKLAQIAFHLQWLLQHKSPEPGPEPQLSLIPTPDLLRMFQSCQRLCAGGIGDEREAQPADELLLVLSSGLRQSFAEVTCTDQRLRFTRAIQWGSILQWGINACRGGGSGALKAQILEPLRILGAGKAASDTFKTLDTKNIQIDTLTYLIFPQLVENGLFGEASSFMETTQTFHKSSRRETLDQMIKCFKGGNYAKAIELKRFVTLCDSSTQLALSQTEGICVSIALGLDDESILKEKIEIMSLISADTLVDHMDYSLQVRVDSDDASESREAARRGEAYRARVRSSIAFVRSIQAFATPTSESNEVATVLKECSISSLGPEAALPPNEKGFSTYLPWDQELWNDIPLGSVLGMRSHLLSICGAIRTEKISSTGIDSSLVADCVSFFQGCISKVKELIPKAFLDESRLLDNFVLGVPFIHVASAFVFNFLGMTVLLRQPLYYTHPVMRQVLVEILDFIRELVKGLVLFSSSLPSASVQSLTSSFSVLSISAADEQTSPSSSGFFQSYIDFSGSSLKFELLESEKMFVDRLIESYRSSCDQLTRVINKHKHCLEEVLPSS